MLPVNIARIIEMHNLERREHIRLFNLERRIMRDESDPFSLRDEQFISLFRLSKGMVRYLRNELEVHVNITENIVAIPLMLKLLATLNFFATGSYQQSVGQGYNFSVAKPTMSKVDCQLSGCNFHEPPLTKIV
ncbi:hypothetical protein PPYR_15280 [Photinus pyralis]|uniref:DDE Tnp4 domain-containing protein n=1 Tax=Photinus pyralis TaxID=7054 RepID=A0A5N3ZZ61_PHOPY|nr:hypothetical protein PPYR_15280 [Photinus pyralis]